MPRLSADIGGQTQETHLVRFSPGPHARVILFAALTALNCITTMGAGESVIFIGNSSPATGGDQVNVYDASG